MRKYIIACVFLLLGGMSVAQTEAKFPKQNQFVNDYSGMLNEAERDALTKRLNAFNDTTSNQIAILITPTLYGEEIMELGVRIAQMWGLGQKNLDNGVLIMIKSKTEEEPFGDVAILPGEGLEGVMPDILCKHITDEMVPALGEGRYYDALVLALDIIEPACLGEFDYDQLVGGDDSGDTLAMVITWIIIIIVVTTLLRSGGKGSGHHRGGGSSWGSFSSHSGGSWSSSSSRSFGGGSFSGGGAHSRF